MEICVNIETDDYCWSRIRSKFSWRECLNQALAQKPYEFTFFTVVLEVVANQDSVYH